jgi:hypothetical protein
MLVLIGMAASLRLRALRRGLSRLARFEPKQDFLEQLARIALDSREVLEQHRAHDSEFSRKSSSRFS